MAKPITLSHRVRSGGWESMISANGGLAAKRYTPQVTQRWPRGSELASGLVAGQMWDAWARNILVCHAFPRGPRPLACGLLWFACGGVSCFLGFCFCASSFVLFSFSFSFFFDAHTSRLAPMARTLLGVLGHTSRLACSWFSVCVLSFATSANSGVKPFGGFLR